MRNIFDQYSQAENRLTHALVCSLAEDRKLLRGFVHWATGKKAPKAADLRILEQRLPGEPEVSEEEAERRGLPDAWIHDGQGWSLLIESKVSAKLQNDQLRRHILTAKRRGFDDVRILALDVTTPRNLPNGCLFRRWTEVYTWLKQRESRSEWAERTARYMEIAETRWTANGYLTEGALTTFAGIPFDRDNPWNYPEAKRLLRLAMDELCASKRLQREVGLDPNGQRRPAITGSNSGQVWDFTTLRQARHEEQFTRTVHLTMALTNEHVFVTSIVPNSIRATYRKNLTGSGNDEFVKIMGDITEEFDRLLGDVKGAVPWVELVQRRYKSQRSEPNIDARMRFDLHTAFPKNTGTNQHERPVKNQPLWLETVYELLSNKKGNLQLAVGVSFPLDKCEILKSRQALDAFERAWLSLKPLIAATVGLPKK